VLTGTKKKGFVAMVVDAYDTSMLWHRRLGHSNY
jgi:hypothetical protein